MNNEHNLVSDILNWNLKQGNYRVIVKRNLMTMNFSKCAYLVELTRKQKLLLGLSR